MYYENFITCPSRCKQYFVAEVANSQFGFGKICTASRGTTRSSAIAEGPRDASCQLKSCQLPRNSAETTYTTSPDQIDGMKLEI